MPTYHVFVPEVHFQRVEIKAESPEEAAQRVNEDEGERVEDLEFSHVLDSDTRMVVDLATQESCMVSLDDEDSDEEEEG